ncbi:MAG: hypothetical protein ACRELY_23365 [Polyangiaceae bacterium]
MRPQVFRCRKKPRNRATLMVSDQKGRAMASTEPTKRDLASDEKGAVMIMGLAMMLGLIAFLWYIMGIGETLAFRDHMQDGADSAAFSQMAVEAAGMNFIVLLNMIIMLSVIVYLILSVILTAFWANMVADLLTCFDIFGGEFTCAEGFVELGEYPGLYSDRGDAAKILSYIDMGLSIIQSGAALIAPWAGTAAGIDASANYKMHSQTDAPFALSFGSNNFSPDTLTILGSFGKKTHVDGGLPVTHEFLANDCSHVVEMTVGAIANLLGGRGGGKAFGILNKIAGAFAQMVQWYWCDNNGPPIPGLGSIVGKAIKFLPFPFRELIGGGDEASYWTAEGYGPMTNYKHKDINPDGHVTFGTIMDSLKPTEARHDPEAKNGADRNQAFSVLVAPNAFEDAAATHNIKLMQLQHMQGFTNNAEVHPSFLFYFSQAELYFDCEKESGWRSPDCDDVTGNFDHEDQTMYSFSWRARLVKFHTPEGAAITKVLDFINKGLSMITDIKGWFNGQASNPFIQALQFLDKALGIDIIGFLGSIADIPPTQIFH